MSIVDRRGVPVSTASHAALERLETAADLFHGYFGDPIATIDKALSEDPDFVMGHCFRAGVLATCTDKALEPELRASVEAGEALWQRANERERGHLAAARAWLDGDLAAAVERWSAVLLEAPRDSLALQFAHLGDFYLGQSSMLRDRVARVLPHWDADVAGYLVLRGVPGDATLQTLTPAPIPDTRYTDTTVTPGTRYVYAVRAVDGQATPNVSVDSARVEETAR